MTGKLRNQKEFLKLSTNSKLITTSKSGHMIFITEPELALQAIREVMVAVRKKSKLR